MTREEPIRTYGNTEPWHVESNGANAVPDAERHGRPRDVFWIWFAGNLNITAIVIGAVIYSYGLSWFQSLVALLGLAAFWLVGYFGIPGMTQGRPTMVLSEQLFGRIGNKFPTAVSWLNLVGWETVMLVIAAFAFQGVLSLAFHWTGGATLILSLAVVTAAAFSIAFLGYATIAKMQTIFAYLFGILSVGVFALLLPHVKQGFVKVRLTEMIEQTTNP
ncbi:cytosine permease [Sulfobacillus harzensis]|uniref:Allantoin permease n=1 Tax=Sulfobacillus harzensis TaxID=2729629 RepID=A0A7Y0Q5G6_9FIRM|nr:cytosine permease [Sulfobacillus harzensis]NMP24289.1 hypothetical protein [Sulfobacillus harzensis]